MHNNSSKAGHARAKQRYNEQVAHISSLNQSYTNLMTPINTGSSSNGQASYLQQSYEMGNSPRTNNV